MTHNVRTSVKIFLVLGVLALVIGAASAQWNRDRTIPPGQTATLAVINTCQPESNATAAGWDQTPTSGSWGGKDESQFAVAWEPGFADVPDTNFSGGRFAKCTIAGATGKTPKKIEMLVLEGLANDDYCVFASVAAGDLLIGCYNETSLTEVWKVHTWDLPVNAFSPGQDVTVKILVTGNAWPSFTTWGQVAVDYITILGE